MFRDLHMRCLSATIALLVCVGMAAAQEAGAGCAMESSGDKTGPLMVHLAPDCTPAERAAHVVSGAAIVEAMAHERAVDLRGVIVRGDISFDELTVQKTQMPKGLSADQQAALRALNAEELRVVGAAVSLRDSVVEGKIRHRSAKGTLQFERPVDFRGTTFHEGVDLSRGLFQGGLDLAGAVFDKEAYFVQGQFTGALKCMDTKFGPHTRFHRSVFRGAVDCTGALFDGLAEFLEVDFQQPLAVERARFGSGTGFSGSHFAGKADFGQAIFSRDAFFPFAKFDGEATFGGAQFLGTADFSDAEFRQADDLKKARFDQPPLLARAKRNMPAEASGWLQSPAGQYGVTVVFLLLAALLGAYAFKLK